MEDLRAENLIRDTLLPSGAVRNFDEDLRLEAASFSAADSHLVKGFITKADFLDEDLLLEADLLFEADAFLDEDLLLNRDLLVNFGILAEGDLLVDDLE